MERDDEALPEIHVFVPDAAPDAVPPARPREDPSGVWRMGLPKWTRWAAGILLVAGIGVLVSVTSSDGEDGDDGDDGSESADPTAPSPTPPTTSSADAEPTAGTDEVTQALDTLRGISWSVTTTRVGGEPATVVQLLDGSEVTLPHPRGVTDQRADVILDAQLWLVGLSQCCRRAVLATEASFDEVFGRAAPVLQLPGRPERGSLFGTDLTQVLAFGVGDWTIAIVAGGDRPFTLSELTLYADLLTIQDVGPGLPPRLDARPPLAVGGAGARIAFDGDSPYVVSVTDMAFSGCVDDGASGAFFVACVDEFQVFGGRDADPGIESPEVSVQRFPQDAVAYIPTATVASPAGVAAPILANGTTVVMGGARSGAVVGVVERIGGVSWTTTIGESAFVSPVVVNGTVFASPHRGSLLALDAGTGERLWTLPLSDTQGIGPLAVVDTPTRSEPLLVVPTYFDADADAAEARPLVYGVDAVTGLVTWRVSLASDVTTGSWGPTVAGDTIVVAGRLAVDNRDSQVIVYGITTSGALAWTHTVAAVTTSDDAPVAPSPTVVLVRDGDEAVDGLDATTGELLWRHEAGITVWKIETDGDVVEIFTIDDESVRLDTRSGTAAN